MYEDGLTCRKIAYFDDSIFDQFRSELSEFDWNPIEYKGRPNFKKHLRPDGTYMIYFPNNAERIVGFAKEMNPIWEPVMNLTGTILPVIRHLMSLTGIEDPYLAQLDLAHMPPGGRTILHTDTRVVQRYSRRYNVAIKTNEDCFLYHNSYNIDDGGTRDHIALGEIWELNNKIPHDAVNDGNEWRTHLVLDVMPRMYWDRLCELFPNPFDKVPNPQGLNTTYDYDENNNLLDFPVLFEDKEHCFKARIDIHDE